MTTLTLHDGALHVSFTAREKLAGLIRDQRFPLASVRRVDVVPDGAAAARGIRAPGLGLPGFRLIGTWRMPTGKALVAVHGHRPAVRITLDGERWAELLVAVDDPESLAARLGAAVPGAGRS